MLFKSNRESSFQRNDIDALCVEFTVNSDRMHHESVCYPFLVKRRLEDLKSKLKHLANRFITINHKPLMQNFLSSLYKIYNDDPMINPKFQS